MSSGTIAPEQLRHLFERVIPFNRFLGMRVSELGDGRARIEIPYRAELLGNPLGLTLHGGVISSLLDVCGGAAVWTQISANATVATVDLRVDYLRPGRPDTLIGTGAVVRLGNRVGVAELRAFHTGAEDEPVAAGMAVYTVRRDGAGTDIWTAVSGER